MDPVSQGALGAALPQAFARPEHVRSYALLGCLSGMAPDLDVLIQSDVDPLLFLEYHRQFTHSFLFIPIGALICATILFLPLRSKIDFKQAYLACFLGYAAHGSLDACTSYGTQLLWPFSDLRLDWSNVSVIDPLFTIPLILLGLAAFFWRKPWIALIGLVWALGYLTVGFTQQTRAEEAARTLVEKRGHLALRFEVKPSFGNLLVWKLIYEHEGRYYVDAIRAGSEVTVCQGTSIAKLDTHAQFPWMRISSQQAIDIERFRWFSNDFLGTQPDDPDLIIDVRYSTLPHHIDGLWGIRIDRGTSDSGHVTFETRREDRSSQFPRLVNMVLGESC